MPITECELAFARAMLAEPESAMHRLAYADWLEECGDARAALVREAGGWSAGFPYPDRPNIIRLGDGLPQSVRFSIVAMERYAPHLGMVIRWDGDGLRREHRFLIDEIGSSPDDPRNWAWLLSLALARGLKVPGLAGNRGNPPDGY